MHSFALDYYCPYCVLRHQSRHPVSLAPTTLGGHVGREGEGPAAWQPEPVFTCGRR